MVSPLIPAGAVIRVLSATFEPEAVGVSVPAIVNHPLAWQI